MKLRVFAIVILAILLPFGIFFSNPFTEANSIYRAFTDENFEAFEYCLDFHEEYDSTLPSTAHQTGQYPNEEMILKILLEVETKVKISERRKPCAGKLT